jgi:GAF domain-containing protein
VWAALARQRARVEEANEWLYQKSAETSELRVPHVAVREEAVLAREAEAKAREDAARAREEAAKAHKDLAPLLARVKELEEDIALVGGQCNSLNVQVGMVSARVRTLEGEVVTLTRMVRERDEALSGAGREVEAMAGQTQLLQGTIASVCDDLGVEPNADTKEDAPRNSFVHRMVALGCLVRERIRDGLQNGVKRSLAVVRSGFMYDMDLITDGFITDPDRTDEENEVTCLGRIEAAEEPRSRLAKLFEVEVVPPAGDEGL